MEGEVRTPFDGVQALRLKASRADYEHTEFEGDEVGTVFTNEGHDVRLEVLHEPWGELHGAIGAKLGRSKFDAVGDEAFLPATTTNDAAVFLFEEIEHGPHLWQFGARAEHQSIKTRDGSGRRHQGDGISASVGWVHQFGEAWSLALSGSHTERLPTAQELFADGPHIGTNAYEIGDARLGTEISNGLDLTLRKRIGVVSGAATVFVSQFNGYIFENPTGGEEDGLPVFAFEQHDARFHGAELETRIHLHEDEHGHLDLALSGDIVRARNRSNDTNLPRTTPARLGVALDWERNAWRAGTELRHAFAQNRVAAGEPPTADHTLLAAHVGYRWFTPRVVWDLLLRGTNLTDAEARAHTSFLKEVAPLPGRNVTLSLRASF